MTSARAFKQAFGEFRWLLVFAGLYAAIVSFLAVVVCKAPWNEFQITVYAPVMVALKCMIFFAAMGGVVWARGFSKGGAKKAKEYFDRANREYIDGPMFPRACWSVLVLCGVAFFFTAKSLIPKLNPYASDPLLAKIDKAVHFGHYPHEWFVPAADALHFSPVLDGAYLIWFAVMYAGLAFNIFLDRDLERRRRFLWSFTLTWVLLGTVMATILSSTGPLFYGNFYPNLTDPYRDLVAHFDMLAKQGQNLSTARGRDLLLAWAKNDRVINVNAISAMPSMHCAVSWLTVLYAWKIGRVSFGLALAFFFAIFWGSVYFGYHYAIDGYVSVACVSLIWWGMGRIFAKRAAS